MGIWVGRYAIAHGEVMEHGPWLVERRRSQHEQPVRLLVLAEPLDERSAEFCHEVADAIAALFRREALSVTGGLLRALRQAHANLAEWNRRSLREHRVAVGVTCVVVSEREVTIAQVGPCVALVRSGTVLRRLSPVGPGARPLGGSDAIEPAFERIVLPRDELLLVTANVEAVLGYDAIAAAFAEGPERALAELFLQTREVSDMTAVLVADLPQVEDTELLSDDEDDEEPEPLLEPVPAARVESAPPPRPRPLPPAGPPLRVRTAGAGGIASPSRAQQIRIGAAALVAMVLAVAAWYTLPGLIKSDRSGRFDEITATIGANLDAVLKTTDPGAARTALAEAQSQLAAARAAAPAGDTRLPELERRVADASATLDRVTEVTDLRRAVEAKNLATLPLQSVSLVGAETLWLVDQSRGRVAAVDLAGGASREVYRSGERYDGVVARDPLVAAWDEQGRRLLVIDSERTLWSIAGTSAPVRLPLRGAAELRSVTALAAYGGNIYLLDGRGGEVWRYLPAGAGFDSERTGLLGGVAFSDARELAVDGDVFVLDGGTLRHFRQGTAQDPLLRGIDRAPQSPVSLVEDVGRGRFYTLEASARRVIVGERGGAFVGQLRNQAFLDAKSIALSPDGGTLYVLTGEALFAIDPLQAR